MKLSLSPSGAKTWMDCTASPQYILKNRIKPVSTKYNKAGGEDHKFAAAYLEAWIGGTRFGLNRQYYDQKRADGIDKYVRHIKSIFTLEKPPIIEKKMPNFYGHGNSIVDCFGVTAENPETLRVIDFKSGWTLVPTANNPQLMIYALNVIEAYGFFFEDIKEVFMQIYQPPRKYFKSVTLPITKLCDFKDEVQSTVDTIVADRDLKFAPSEEACKWCNAKNHCPARADAAQKTLKEFNIFS